MGVTLYVRLVFLCRCTGELRIRIHAYIDSIGEADHSTLQPMVSVNGRYSVPSSTTDRAAPSDRRFPKKVHGI